MTLRFKRKERTNPSTTTILLAVAILVSISKSPALQSGWNISISSDSLSSLFESEVDKAPQAQDSYEASSTNVEPDEKVTGTRADDKPDAKSSPASHNIVFVTASSQNHFGVAQRDILPSLQQEVFGQASKQYDRNFYFKTHLTIHDEDILFDVKMIFYDLDYEKINMIPKEKFLVEKFPYVEYRRFDYQRFPPHVNVSADANGAYAWKPAIIKKVMEEQRKKHQSSSSSTVNPSEPSHSLVYWVDAGTRVIPNGCRLLNRELEMALNYGLFTPENSPLEKWTLPETAFHKLIQLDPELYHNESTNMCTANTILFDATNDTVWENVVTVWTECALETSCIAPPGSSLKNHRYDQAALSCLMAKNGIPAPNRELRCIKRGTG